MPEGSAACGGGVHPLRCKAGAAMLRHAECAAHAARWLAAAMSLRLCVSVTMALPTHDSLITTQQGATSLCVDAAAAAGQSLSDSHK